MDFHPDPELGETCKVLFQNKFEKLVHLVGFIIRIHLVYCKKVVDIIVNKAVFFIYAINLVYTYKVYWDREKNLKNFKFMIPCIISLH